MTKTLPSNTPRTFFCDTSVSSGAARGCEVGTAANVGPVGNPNRSVLYVLVPLFANPDPAPMCAVASCPNHPLDIDLSRLGGPFATATDIPLPAHSHILDGPAGGWWQTVIVPVTSQSGWTALAAGRSAATMDSLEATTGRGVGPEIPTNLGRPGGSRSSRSVGGGDGCRAAVLERSMRKRS